MSKLESHITFLRILEILNEKTTHEIVLDTKQSLQSDRELSNIQYSSSIK